jgi:hypothetical protein
MFINDTGRLPDSGRVCVMGFNPRREAPNTWYAITIVAARAEVEPMAEPRNAHHVLGLGTMVDGVNGPVFAAYFAASRERYDAEPNYKNGLYVLVDGAVYAVQKENVATTLKRGLATREFTLLRGDRPQRSVKYRWPLYRFADSQDFMGEMAVMVRSYG